MLGGKGMAKQPKLMAHRGTALWAVNYFRSDGLSNLLDDLVDAHLPPVLTDPSQAPPNP